jgi:hypothetical protein
MPHCSDIDAVVSQGVTQALGLLAAFLAQVALVAAVTGHEASRITTTRGKGMAKQYD